MLLQSIIFLFVEKSLFTRSLALSAGVAAWQDQAGAARA